MGSKYGEEREIANTVNWHWKQQIQFLQTLKETILKVGIGKKKIQALRDITVTTAAITISTTTKNTSNFDDHHIISTQNNWTLLLFKLKNGCHTFLLNKIKLWLQFFHAKTGFLFYWFKCLARSRILLLLHNAHDHFDQLYSYIYLPPLALLNLIKHSPLLSLLNLFRRVHFCQYWAF